MVDNIPHTIAIGMHHVVCKGNLHDHVVCILAMWYAFLAIYDVIHNSLGLISAQVRILGVSCHLFICTFH